MKFLTPNERIHVMDENSTVETVFGEIINSGLQEDAFYICDIGDIVRKHKLFKALMPRVEPFYAVKCNDTPTVLETLAALGTGFDCASKTEINKILSLGVDPSRIIFANPAKVSSHIRHASATNVDLMTFDNETELYKIKNLFPTARLVIRLKSDALDSQCCLGMKYGCDPVLEAPQLLDLAKSLGIQVVGASFHVGSGCRESLAFTRAIEACREVFDYANSIGFNMNLLDIGGGFPGNQGAAILEEIANEVNQALDTFFPDKNLNIIAEPGRFYVATAFTLACCIHSIRSVINADRATGTKSKHIMYYINDGIYGSFNCLLYDHQKVTPEPFKINPGVRVYNSSIWGPTCDGLDQVAENYPLPEMKVGDWFIFKDMGAYTISVATPFNGFPVPKVHIVADNNIWQLLKDLVPFSDNQFVTGNSPANFRIGLGTEISENWSIPKIYNNNMFINEGLLDNTIIQL